MSFVKTLATLAAGFAVARGYDAFRKMGGMTGVQDQLRNAGGEGGIGQQVGQIKVDQDRIKPPLSRRSQRLGAILSGPIIALGALPGLGYAWVFAACVPLVLLGLGLLAVARRLGR